jgi:Zn-dependent peptidase ImmA (M78 family)
MANLSWKIAEGRLAAARESAEELTRMLKLAEPIDPFAIATAESPMLRVLADDFGTQFDGQLEYHAAKRRFLMFVNTRYNDACPPGEHHPRTRFSAAHELGHYFLDHHRACLLQGANPHPSRSEFRSDVMMEREADAFASALLMPEGLMRPLVNEDELSSGRVAELAGRFRASPVSTIIRAVQLSDFPVAVVGIRDGLVAWQFPAPCLIDAGVYPGERGPLRSMPCRQKWAAFSAGDTEQTTGQACVREWFRTYSRENLELLPVTEHYIPAPVMDTLIVLLTIPEDELFHDADED